MADKVNVITLAGSLRKGSFNAALARQLRKWAPDGMSIAEAPPGPTFRSTTRTTRVRPAFRRPPRSSPTRSAPPTA